MKKSLAIFLVMIMACVSGCGGSGQQAAQADQNAAATAEKAEEPSRAEQMYEKYGSIINKLEEEDYAGAIEEISGMMPKPEIIETRITTDNFYDYYEIHQLENYIERDAQGNIMRLSRSNPGFNFELKDQYEMHYEEGDNVAVGVNISFKLFHVDQIDKETGEIKYSQESYDDLEDRILHDLYYIEEGEPEPEKPVISLTTEGTNIIYINGAVPTEVTEFIYYDESEERWRSEYALEPGSDPKEKLENLYVYCPVDTEIVRAEGTLHIAEK